MAYSITLTVELKEGGASRLVGTQTLSNFTAGSRDVETAQNFAKGDAVRQLINTMGLIAKGVLIYGATQTIQINDL